MEKDFNFIDRFLYKFIICLVLLLSVLLLDKINIINKEELKEKISYNVNFLKAFQLINGKDGAIIPIDLDENIDQKVSLTYQVYKEIPNGKRIIIKDMQGVEVYKTGIIIKIYQNQNNTYQVTVKGIDNIEYVYDNLESINCNIYKIVNSGNVIGHPSKKNNENYFDFFIKI